MIVWLQQDKEQKQGITKSETGKINTRNNEECQKGNLRRCDGVAPAIAISYKEQQHMQRQYEEQ